MTRKTINKIKLTVTTDCNLHCNYCFVKRTNESMDLTTARNAVDLFLKAPGKNKLFSIYGGEPLLNFRLMEQICPYAISRARRSRKALDISVCTNLTALKERHIVFLKERGIKVIVSMAGIKKRHNRFRVFNNKKGTYDSVRGKLPLLFKNIPRENIGASLCVFPSAAGSVDEDFMHLVKLGFNYINFEIIREYQYWSLEKITQFALGLKKIIKYVFDQARENNFIFLNPINWEIKHRLLTRSLGANCPFNYKLEVYPKGEMAFSPFLFNSPEKDKYIIGSVNDNGAVLKRFPGCRFNSASGRCRSCEYEYFKDYSFDQGASKLYRLYQIICLEAAEFIKSNSRKKPAFARYIRHADNICF